MVEIIWFCPNCMYRVNRKDQDPESHKKKFGCDKFEKELLRIRDGYWMRGIFEQLDEAENFLIGEFMGSLLGSYELKKVRRARRTRIAFILIDNAIEMMINFKIRMTPFKKRFKKPTGWTGGVFQAKLKKLHLDNVVSEDKMNLSNVFHIIRNELYHDIFPEARLLLKLANTYLVFSRNFLKKLYNVIYPLKEKREVLNFGEAEIINLFSNLVKTQSSQLIEYIEIERREIFDDFCKMNKELVYDDYKQYIEDMINVFTLSRGYKRYFDLFEKLNRGEIRKIIYYKDLENLMDSGVEIAKLPEGSAEERIYKVKKLIKTLAKINEVNEILGDNIGYWEAQADALVHP